MQRLGVARGGRSGSFVASIAMVLTAELLFALAVTMVLGRPPEAFTTIGFGLIVAGALAYQDRDTHA